MLATLPEGHRLKYRRALDEYDAHRFSEALRLAKMLIDAGFGHANALAGAILEEGGHGVEQDYGAALHYYQQATEQVGSVEGWLGLGRLHFFGRGVLQSYEKAFGYYDTVREDSDNPVARLMLGRMYLEGLGVPRDTAKARQCLREAVAGGSIYAISYLATAEAAEGDVLLSFWHRLRASFLAFWVSRVDPRSPRLRLQ